MKLSNKNTFQKDGKWYRVKTTFADLITCVEIKENTKRAKMNAPTVQFNLNDIRQNIIDQLNVELKAGRGRIKTLVSDIVADFKKDKYYRLYDKQTQRYMATGFNAHGIAELGEQYWEYISTEHNEDDAGDREVKTILNEGKDEAKIRSIIEANGFEIEDNETPFCIECNSTNTEAFNDLGSGKWLCRCKDCEAEGVV
jgi:hypothetical protein